MLWRPPSGVSALLRKLATKQLSASRCPFSSIVSIVYRPIERGYKRKYRPSSLGAVEDVEGYVTGGFHPLAIRDVLGDGRYKALHKLGFGRSSTVWLARDQMCQAPSSPLGRLVSLKIMAASCSSRPLEEIPELDIPSKLEASFGPGQALQKNIQRIENHFMENGPNGSHLCLVSPFAGPSVLTMSESLSRSNHKLRADLTRKLAKQVTSVIERMHSSGFIHGDISSSNVLFTLADDVYTWTNSELDAMFAEAKLEEVQTSDGSPLGPSAPRYIVDAVEGSYLVHSCLLQENVMVIDFGQSFEAAKKPRDYLPGTDLHSTPPEVRFSSTIDFRSDVWMLACTIFEIRAGYSLFDSFFGIRSLVLRETVETLGKLPEPWWEMFENRHTWFEENGEPKPKDVQEKEGVMLPSSKSSIRQKLREIGDKEGPVYSGVGSLSEDTGARMAEEEVELLGDLLEKMLRYQPSERITMQEVARHPWFSYGV